MANPFDQFDASNESSDASSNPFDQFDSGSADMPLADRRVQAMTDHEKLIKDANEKKGFIENLGEGLTRGAERGTLGLLQAGSQFLPDSMQPNAEDMADIARETRMQGQGTGAGGLIGETALDPRYASLLASGPMGWAARGATGAAIGATDPVETADRSEGNIDRAKHAALTGGAFVAVPAILDKGISIAKPILDKMGTSGAGYFPGTTTRDAVKKEISSNREDAVASAAYDRVARILINQFNMSPEDALAAAKKTVDSKTDGTLPLTLPEALGNDKLLKEQRVLGELSTPAGNKFSEFNQNRLSENLPEVRENLVSNAGEGTGISTMTQAGDKIKSAASKALEKAREGLRSIGSGYTDLLGTEIPKENSLSLRKNPLVEETYQEVLKNPSLMGKEYEFSNKLDIPPEVKSAIEKLSPDAQKQALSQLGLTPKQTKTLTGGFSNDSFNAWKSTKEQLDALAREQYNKYGRSSPQGVQYTRAANSVNNFLQETEEKYAQLNSTYGTARKGVVDLENSPIGKLATANDPEQAANIFKNLSREQLQKVVPHLQAIDPEATKNMASAYMREITDKTPDQGLQSYVNALSKNKVVRDKMQAIMSPDAYTAQQEVVNTLKQVIKGQPRNSETVAKGEILNSIDNDTMAGKLSNILPALKTLVVNPKMATYKALRWTQGISTGKLRSDTHEQLMNVFLNPDLDALGKALNKVSSPEKKQNLILQYIGDALGGGEARAITAGEKQNLSSPASPQKLPDVQLPQKGIDPSLRKTVSDDEVHGNIGTDHLHPSTLDVLDRFARAESNNNANAKNPNSSASGLLQFTDGTWKKYVNKYGKQTGIRLQDKSNPQAQKIMGALLANDNAGTLKRSIKRDPSVGEVYMAHVFGPSSASKLINAKGAGQQASLLFSAPVVKANRSLFFSGNKPRTAEQLYKILNDKVS